VLFWKDVSDTNILINLIHVGLLDLLEKLPTYTFVVPEEVAKEVSDPLQNQALREALAHGVLQVTQLTEVAELTI